MISRTFTVDDGEGELHCYKGFNREFMDAPFIATVFCEGEWEMWALDNMEAAVQEFTRYLSPNAICAFYKNEFGDHVPQKDHK